MVVRFIVRTAICSLIFSPFAFPLLAGNSTECRDQATVAYNAALKKEEGQSDDDVITWILQVTDKLEKIGAEKKEVERALSGGMMALVMIGSAQTIGQSVYDICMEK